MASVGAAGQWRERLLSITMRQKVVVVVPEGGSLFEIATPLRVWGPDPREPRWSAVDLVTCGTDAGGVGQVGLAWTGAVP